MMETESAGGGRRMCLVGPVGGLPVLWVDGSVVVFLLLGLSLSRACGLVLLGP
jgi:hypothetical protein